MPKVTLPRIRVRIETELPVPYAVFRCQDDVLILRNPALTVWHPTWLQEHLVNQALERAMQSPPGGKQSDNVIVLTEHKVFLDHLERVGAGSIPQQDSGRGSR